jgi:hypothetical protein
MEAIVSRVIPFLINITMIAAMMLMLMVMVMGVGWASGKIIRKLFGLGGN